MTPQQKEFSCYCLDRLKVNELDFCVTYSDDAVIRKQYYKVGLRADIRHRDCFILYTESEKDLDEFIYINAEEFYDNQKRFFQDLFSKEEVNGLFKKITTINIFEFTSLLKFNSIYEDFQDYIKQNWVVLDMDNLIEI